MDGIQGQAPVLSGGRRVTGWTRTTVNGRDAWTTKLPDGGKAAGIHELWLDGKRLTRDRWPKKGTLEVVGPSDKEKRPWNQGTDQFRYAQGDIDNWPNATDGEAVVADRWVESHLPIASIDAKEHVIHFTKRSHLAIEAGDRYWIENVRQCLTEPGEFYADPRGKALYLIAPEGVDPNKAQVVARGSSRCCGLRATPPPAGSSST